MGAANACRAGILAAAQAPATWVRAQVQLHHSLVDWGSLQADVDVLLKDLDQVLHKMDRALMAQAQRLGWAAEVTRCRALPGVGPLTALALVALDHRGEFVCADAFIAFMGMDARVRESGQWHGRRKLTQKGDPEVRRLLFNAAMQARRSSAMGAVLPGAQTARIECHGGLRRAGSQARAGRLCVTSG